MLHICEAPICLQDTNPNWRSETVWFPGEKVCNLKPYTTIQKKQFLINVGIKEGTFKDIRPLTANQLSRLLV